MDWLFRYADPSLDWNFAMITLAVRFVGVFVVMLVMQVALQGAAVVVGRIERRRENPPAPPPVVGLDLPEMAPTTALDDATAAAIGLAMELEMRPRTRPLSAAGPSPWAVAGRMQQLHRRSRG